jgi:hypothetical protein
MDPCHIGRADLARLYKNAILYRVARGHAREFGGGKPPLCGRPTREITMTKNCIFGLALISIALSTGCAKGLGSTPSVTVSDGNVSVLGVTMTVQFTATVTGTNNPAVTWRLSGGGCSGGGNPCGTIDPNGLFTAPAKAPSPAAVTVIATSQADPGGKGQLTITVKQITVSVTPAPVNVGQGLVQQFTATAVPDNAPQTFTWAVFCTQGGTACGTLVQDAKISGLAVYTAPAVPPAGVQVTATSTIDPTGVGTVKVPVVSSRLAANSTYSFRFSGFDSTQHSVAIAGNFTLAPGGAFEQGVEDLLVNLGSGSALQRLTMTGVNFTPVQNVNNADNTNNAGTLTLNAPGASATQFQAVLDATGSIRVIESDGNGSGSGAMERSAAGQFNTGPQKFVFGFTGTDAGGNRVGYVGLLPLTPSNATSGTISGGLLDPNENSITNDVCGAPPCSVSGTYNADGTIPGLWHMSLTVGRTLDFDFFVSNGQTATVNPLTLFAISADTIDTTHPLLSGTLVFQDPTVTYDKTALNAPAVANLSGVDPTGAQVSLAVVAGDGNGNLNGTFDANNAGTIVAAQNFNCTYTTGTGGRYVLTLLGNGSTCTAPGRPFVLYASGANRGFLLDQSNAAVMTGTLDPQRANTLFAPSELPSTYAASTASSATSALPPLASNLLLTSPGNQVFNVSGTQYPGAVAVSGSYTLLLTGTGTMVLTAPPTNYVMYVIDASHFELIDVDASNRNPSVIFAQQ